MLLNYVSKICKCTSSSHQTYQEKEDTEKSSTAPPSPPENPLEEYDPYAHGKQQHPTIFWGSIFHLFKVAVGTGVLSLPYAFKNVGYGLAIFGVILVGSIYINVLHNLLEVEYELCKKMRIPNLTYAGVVEHSFEKGPRYVRGFAPVAKLFVYFHYLFNKSIANAIAIITIGGNIKIIIDHYYNTDINIVSVITALVVIITPLALIRNLKSLAPLSLLTNSFNLINFILILAIPLDYSGLADFKAINDITKFPYFFSLVLRAFNCTVIILPLKNDMKEPKKFSTFSGVLNIASFAAGTVYCTFGGLGYAKYGDRVEPNFLQNLPPDQTVSLAVLGLFSSSICVSFLLTLYVSFDIVWNSILKDRKMNNPIVIEYVLRIILCIVPYCIAVALPDFKIMVALSAVNGILMDEIVPIILHILLLLQKKSKGIRVYLVLMKDLAFVLICLVLFCAAFLDLIRSIVKFYN